MYDFMSCAIYNDTIDSSTALVYSPLVFLYIIQYCCQFIYARNQHTIIDFCRFFRCPLGFSGKVCEYGPSCVNVTCPADSICVIGQNSQVLCRFDFSTL